MADIHDKIWIRKARQKAKNRCNIPLLDEAQKMIDRYSSLLPNARRAAPRMQQPEDELLPEGAGRHLRHLQESLDALRKTLRLLLLIENHTLIQTTCLADNDSGTSKIPYTVSFCIISKEHYPQSSGNNSFLKIHSLIKNTSTDLSQSNAPKSGKNHQQHFKAEYTDNRSPYRP